MDIHGIDGKNWLRLTTTRNRMGLLSSNPLSITLMPYQSSQYFQFVTSLNTYLNARTTVRRDNGAVQMSGSRAKVIPSQILLDFGHQKKGVLLYNLGYI